MGVPVKLNGTANLSVASFTPHYPNSDDTVYLNNFNLTCDINLTCAAISSAAEATTGAVAGGAVLTGNNPVSLIFDLISANTQSAGMFRPIPPITGTTQWIGNASGIGSYIIFPVGTNPTTLIISPTSINSVAGNFMLLNGLTNPNTNLIINAPTNITSQFALKTAGTSCKIFYNAASYSGTQPYFLNSSLISATDVSIIGYINASTSILFSDISTTNIFSFIVEKIDFTTGSVFPLTANRIKFSSQSTSFCKANFFDNVLRNMSANSIVDVAENDVRKGVVFDNGNKVGNVYVPLEENVSINTLVDVSGVGTAYVKIEDILNSLAPELIQRFFDEVQTSPHPTAQHINNSASYQFVQQILKETLPNEVH